MTALGLALVIGLLAGLRSLTPPAAVAWGVRLGWLHLPNGLAWVGSLPSVLFFTLLAILELITDKLPKTPSRTAPLGLSARIVTGGLTGACVAAAGGASALAGALLGIAGGVAGCFGGYQVRTRLVKATGSPDIYVALIEDLVAIVGSLWAVSRF